MHQTRLFRRRLLCHKVNLLSCAAWRPLCHQVNLQSCVVRWMLRHKVNLPRCEAWRHHFIMTCDIFSIGQTNILALCYLFGKTYKPAHSRTTQVTEINTLDQISTEEVIDVSIHIPLKALMIPFKRVSCMVYLNQCSNTDSLCPSVHHKKVVLGQ